MTIELSQNAPTKFIEANGITYAYRRLGQPSGVQFVMPDGGLTPRRSKNPVA